MSGDKSGRTSPRRELRAAQRAVEELPVAIWLLLTTGVALLIYQPSVTHAFEFDDINVLYQSIVRVPNPLYLILQFDGQTTGGSWRPMLHVVMWVEWHLLGADAIGYHVVNVLLHACTVFVLGALAFQISGRRSVAICVGALFLVQPLPEAVSWIVAGPLNVMSALFYLAAMLFYIRWRRGSQGRDVVLALALVVLSLSCYEVALTFFLAVIAYDVLFEWGEWTARQRLQRTGGAVFVALTVNVAFAATRAAILGVLVGSYGASTVFGFDSFATRFATVIGTLWAPANGAMPTTSTVANATMLFEISLLVAILSIVLLRPSLRPVALGLTVAAIAFLPFAGFMSVTRDLASSRYLYLSTAGLALAIGSALARGQLRYRVPVVGALVASAAIILNSNLVPWALAGAMVDGTVKAARLGPVQTFGVQVHDIYGAYTFGTASNIPEYPGANGIDVVMDGAWVAGRSHMYWDGIGSLVSLGNSPVVAWTGPELRAWSWSSTVTLQASADSLAVTSSDGDPFGWSPALSLASERTNAVIVELDAPSGGCMKAQLIWRYTAAGDKLAYSDLEAGLHEYVFVQPTGVRGDSLVGLRLDPLLCPGTVRILSVEVGGHTSP